MKTNRTLIGVVATVAVAGLVIAGLFAVGSPATARKFKADQRRVEQLQQLHRALVNHLGDKGRLPESLSGLNRAYWENFGQPIDPRKDPLTRELFDYRRIDDRLYEVCVEFETSSEDRRNLDGRFRTYPAPLEVGAGDGFFEYKPGRNCFSRTVTDTEIRNYYPQYPPFPGEAGIPPPVRVPGD